MKSNVGLLSAQRKYVADERGILTSMGYQCFVRHVVVSVRA